MPSSTSSQKVIPGLLSPKIKKELGNCLLYTFFWGLLAHAYGFLHDTFSHDSLNALYADAVEEGWKIQIGRIFVPAYRALTRGAIAMPWLIGFLSLVWIALTVFLIIKIFKVRDKLTIFMIAGVFATNVTVSAGAATYIYELDINMFALLLSAFAVFLWYRYQWGFLPGAVVLTLSLGLYQTYFTVSITLILFACIMDLLNQEPFQKVVLHGLKGVGMLLLGTGLYLVLLPLFGQLAGVSLDTGTYNSMISLSSLFQISTLDHISETYLYWLKSYTAFTISRYQIHIMAAIHVLLAAVLFLCVLSAILKKQIHVKEKILILVLGMLIPLGIDLVYILSGGVVHYLMKFSFWLIYLLAFLLINWCVDHDFSPKWSILLRCLRGLVFLLIAFILWANVQTANALYLKKDLEQGATLSLMTRIVYRMEATEGYIPGETPIVFIGVNSQINPLPGFDYCCNITGADSSQVIVQATSTYYYNVYEAYFKYVLQNPAVMGNDEIWTSLQTDSRVADMPSYPAVGCIRFIDGILVVKVS